MSKPIRECQHERLVPECSAENLDDGQRRLMLSVRCLDCERLAIFPGLANKDGGPVAHTGARVLSLPFHMQGTVF